MHSLALALRDRLLVLICGRPQWITKALDGLLSFAPSDIPVYRARRLAYPSTGRLLFLVLRASHSLVIYGLPMKFGCFEDMPQLGSDR